MKKMSLSLLIFTSDKMAKEIAENLKAVRPNWDWKISFVADPQSAIERFKALKPALVFLGEKLPETTPSAFGRELMKISTESSLFCFSESESEDRHEFESLLWPVVSWEQCADQILSGLSKELQEKLGGRKNLSPLRSSLLNYSKQYQTSAATNSDLKKRVWIPVHRNLQKSAVTEGFSAKDPGKVLAQEQREIQVASKMEWLILGGSILMGSAFWIYQPEEEMVLLSGLRLMSGAVVAVSFLGFFISRAFFKFKK